MTRRATIAIAILLVAILVVSIVLIARSDAFADASIERVSDMIRMWGVWAPLLSILLMVAQSLAAPVPAVLIAAANGVVFGYAGIVVSFAGGIAGATVAFVVARMLGRLIASMRINTSRFEAKVREISSDRGFVIVLVSRLIPFVSFDLISFAAGLSSLSFARFITATAIGMAPATVVYTIGGVQARALENYSRVVLIATVAALMLSVVVWATRRLRSDRG